MGNEGSKNQTEYGYIFIQTDKPYYFGGEEVTGHIYLSVQKEFPGKFLNFKINGREESWWHETKTQSANKRGSDGEQEWGVGLIHTQHKGLNLFYCYRVVVHEWQENLIPVGQYDFPFKFKLLDFLPGSIEDKKTTSLALINYCIKAEINPAQGTDKSVKKIKHKQELIIRQNPGDELKEQTKELILSPKSLYCIGRGDSFIRCKFQKNSYLPGDIAVIECEIDNSQCSVDVKRITAMLTKKTTLAFEQGGDKQLFETIAENSFDGIKAQKTCLEDNQKEVEIALIHQDSKKKIQPSTNGKKVNVEYFLEIKAEMSGCCLCMQKLPNVILPIHIDTPSAEDYGTTQAPSGFEPKQMEVKTFNFTTADQYTKKEKPPAQLTYRQEINAPDKLNKQINEKYDEAKDQLIPKNPASNISIQGIQQKEKGFIQKLKDKFK